MGNFTFARFGLALAGALMCAGLLLRGAPVPAGNAGLFYETVGNPTYGFAWWVIIASTLPQIFGFIYLYDRLSTGVTFLARLALVFTVSGTALQIGLYVINSFVAGSIAAQHASDPAVTADVYYAIYAGDLGMFLAAFVLMNVAGLVLFAIAILRDKTFPAWIGALLVLQYFGLLTPALGIRGTTSLAIEVSAAALLFAAGLAIVLGQRPDIRTNA